MYPLLTRRSASFRLHFGFVRAVSDVRASEAELRELLYAKTEVFFLRFLIAGLSAAIGLLLFLAALLLGWCRCPRARRSRTEVGVETFDEENESPVRPAIRDRSPRRRGARPCFSRPASAATAYSFSSRRSAQRMNSKSFARGISPVTSPCVRAAFLKLSSAWCCAQSS